VMGSTDSALQLAKAVVNTNGGPFHGCALLWIEKSSSEICPSSVKRSSAQWLQAENFSSCGKTPSNSLTLTFRFSTLYRRVLWDPEWVLGAHQTAATENMVSVSFGVPLSSTNTRMRTTAARSPHLVLIPLCYRNTVLQLISAKTLYWPFALQITK